MAQITCSNVSLGYDGETVLSGINFEVNRGDYLCIVGENGSGKSTLIKGLLKIKKAEQGTITLSDGLLPSEIGYLPQQTSIQRDFPASVYEIVLSGRLNSLHRLPFYRASDKKAALEKIELLGISDLRNHCYQELSGGQQQRVLLARALCATGKMLLLDEPVAGLDPIATADLYTAIKDINSSLGITIIMVSHDIPAAVKYASHILHIGHTQLFFGTTEEYVKGDIAKTFITQ